MKVAETDNLPVTTSIGPVLGAATAARKRKVFFLVDSFNIGGTETQAVELALRLPSDRYDVTLGCLQLKGPLLERLHDSPVSVVQFCPKGGIDSFSGAFEILRLARFLRRSHFDVVHTHDLWSNLLGTPAARLAGIPAIISSRRDLGNFAWYQSRRRVWLKRIQNLSHVVLTNANSIRDSLIAQDHFAQQKVRVVHNGVEVERFEAASLRREHIFPGIGNDRVIVLVGNMNSDVKGHPWLIAAAPAIVRDFPRVRFSFVGDGEQRANFERLVENIGLQQSFIFLGRRSDVPAILACCDMAVLPSKAEGLPNAVLEYLAAGLPTVASKVGGNAEIIRNGENGVLVPPQNSDALAQSILQLLRDPGLARRLGDAGRRYVRDNFSFERLIDETDKLYTELLAGRRSH